MKRIISVLLLLAMIFSMTACGQSLEKRAREYVEDEVQWIMIRNHVTPLLITFSEFKEISDVEWEVSGTCDYLDANSKDRSVKFEGKVEYIESRDDFNADVYLK